LEKNNVFCKPFFFSIPEVWTWPFVGPRAVLWRAPYPAKSPSQFHITCFQKVSLPSISLRKLKSSARARWISPFELAKFVLGIQVSKIWELPWSFPFFRCWAHEFGGDLTPYPCLVLVLWLQLIVVVSEAVVFGGVNPLCLLALKKR